MKLKRNDNFIFFEGSNEHFIIMVGLVDCTYSNAYQIVLLYGIRIFCYWKLRNRDKPITLQENTSER